MDFVNRSHAELNLINAFNEHVSAQFSSSVWNSLFWILV
jgi:hypothetical protein